MNKKIQLCLGALCFVVMLCFMANKPALAEFSIPGFELVYTAPVETTLQTEDLRGPTEVWVEMIDGAKKSIDFGQMYASGKEGEEGDRLNQVMERMEAAANRGVKIRFLLEKKTQKASIPETIERLKKMKGLELRYLDYAKLGGGIIHAKYITVDSGKAAYIGSQNFDWRALKHIHETGLRITDKKIARQVQEIFNFDWRASGLLSKGKKVKPLRSKSILGNEKAAAYLVASPNAFDPPGVGNSEAELPRLLAGAQKEVRIQLLDYSPTSYSHTYYALIDTAVRDAYYRGVKIKLMVSHWNQAKPEIDYLKSLAVLPGLEVKIVTLPEAKVGFIPYGRVNHSKIMTIDDKIAWVGTSNWTGGYLDNSRNMEVVIRNEKMAKRLAALHEQMWASAYAKAVDVNKDYPKPSKGKKE